MYQYLLHNGSDDAYIAGSYTVCGGKGVQKVCETSGAAPPGYVLVNPNMLNKWVDFTFTCKQIQEYEPEGDGPSCFWNGGIFHYSGYCTMNRNLVRCLNQMGAHVKPVSWVTDLDITPEEIEEFVRYSKQTVPRGCPCVYSSVASRPYNGPIVHYTMMECEGQLNPEYFSTLQHADEIWVPSEWNKQTFIDSGVKPPICVMPLGVDTKLFHPENNGTALFSSGVKKTVFLSVLSLQWRKGLGPLLDAFCRQYKSEDDVSLVLIMRSPTGENIHRYIQEYLIVMGAKNPPHIVVCETKIPEEIMPRFYNAADVFVLLSRGEGWGLPYCEAAACGIPIVGSDHGGQKMFLDTSCAYLVEPDLRVKVEESMAAISRAYIGTTFADFSESAIQRASELLPRAVVEGQEKARLCRQRMIDRFSWQESAKNVYNRLSEICNNTGI